MTTTTLCRYCGEPVAEEYDPETGQTYRPAYHFGCYHCQVPNGPTVTSLYKGRPCTVRSFVYLLRAREEAAHLASWNRAAWTFVVTDADGRLVDIVTGALPERDSYGNRL